MTRADQPLQALAIANKVRCEGARQRKALIGAPMQQVVEALLHPTDELGRLRLRGLFFPKDSTQRSVIPGVGKHRLHQVFNRLSVGAGRRNWNSELRLGELTQRERNHLIAGLVREAPAAWRNPGGGH